jgi:hypothetical protein
MVVGRTPASVLLDLLLLLSRDPYLLEDAIVLSLWVGMSLGSVIAEEVLCSISKSVLSMLVVRFGSKAHDETMEESLRSSSRS